MTKSVHDRWRVPPGTRVDLRSIDTRATDGAPGDKDETSSASAALVDRLADLQGRLWAEDQRSLLLVLQAMDAGGKDGTIRRVFTGVNPQGVRVWSFKVPSDEERDHDFLWRVHRHAPARGEIGVFNRSHYEDVLVVRVEGVVPEHVWRARYESIRGYEEHLARAGTTIVKVFLHISPEEQKERLEARLADPSKRWKFAASDLDVRAKWSQYREAYEDALGETSTERAPWYVVPADRKWYRDWAVLQILVETLEDMDPRYPPEAEGLEGIVVPEIVD